MSTLPIEALRDELNAVCARGRRLIVQSPTGSGKSTQVPQYLLDDGWLHAPDGTPRRVVVLQPRRIAARLLATRVASERGQAPGGEVGYQIRFENKTSSGTRIKYETEGILLRELFSHPTLDEVQAILFDEFHERHLYADITLARAVQLQETCRPDLLIGVLSATLDVAPLEQYLRGAEVLRSEGRSFPVAIHYLNRKLRTDDAAEMATAAVTCMEQVVRSGQQGDALIFMPGAYEIHRTIRELQQSAPLADTLILPLHGELPPAEQDAAVSRYERRKIIVSTNVAETSLTIDGIQVVIDSGWARMPRFDPHRGINTLWLERISRASADQRAGRAGRTAPGVCYRLWTENEHAGRALQETPEIKRVDLAEAILLLKTVGIESLEAFPWFEFPTPMAVQQALRVLVDLGALREADDALTELGRRMAAFPVHPRYARMLLEAGRQGAVRAAALIAALMQGRPLLEKRRTKTVLQQQQEVLGEQEVSDLFTLMRAWQYARSVRYHTPSCRAVGIHAASARQVEPVFQSFLRIAAQQGLEVDASPPNDDAIAKCVLAGFADQVAKRRDQGTLQCEVVHGRKGRLARHSVVQQAALMVATEMDEIQSGRTAEVHLNGTTAIQEEWLAELFPEALREQRVVSYDATTQRVVCTAQWCYHDLVLARIGQEEPTPEEAARYLADEWERGAWHFNKWDDAMEQWILRVNLLARTCPELELPTLGDAERRLVVEQLCFGHTRVKAVRNLPVRAAVRDLISPALQQAVDRLAPERLHVGGPRPFRLHYEAEQPPFVSARIQELFGLRTLPRIAQGRVVPVVHILAPNQRPVQITSDLDGFWRDHYPRIRQELRRRYPKHAWPEDV